MKKRMLFAIMSAVFLFSIILSSCNFNNNDSLTSGISNSENSHGILSDTADIPYYNDFDSTLTYQNITSGSGFVSSEKNDNNTVSKTDSESNRHGNDSNSSNTSSSGLEVSSGLLNGNANKLSNGSYLHVDGTHLLDNDNNIVQLRGVSTHGLAWYPEYINNELFSQLKDEWGINIVRLAMYTDENGGYCTGGDKEKLKQLIRNGIDCAVNNDLYVIIDWHNLSDGNPNTYKNEAKEFFADLSAEYADVPNVLYEICNEPNGDVSWSDIKSYAEEVIPVIRKNSPNSVILVGTPNWSQYVEQAAADPISDFDNIMYTLHFYAAEHKDSLRNSLKTAIDQGLPVFVSEFGISNADGGGLVDEYQGDEWINLLNSYGVSYVAWNMSNKPESCSLLRSDCAKTSGFSYEDLTASGKWLYRTLTGDDSVSQQQTESTVSENVQIKPNNVNSEQSDSDNISSTESTVTSKPSSVRGTPDVSITKLESWENGGDYFCKYSLNLHNNTDTDFENWQVNLDFNSEISIVSSWNGNYSIDGNTLSITSMDYNGGISTGDSIENIGFIVQGKVGLEII